MNNPSIIGASAVNISDGSFALGRIKGITSGKDGQIRTIFEESSGHSWLKTFKRVVFGKSKKVPLQGLYILEDIKVTTTTFTPVKLKDGNRDGRIRIRCRNSDLSVFPVPLKELQLHEIIVWNPDKSSNPDDSFLGEIKQTAVYFDVTNVVTHYAELLVLNRLEHLRTGRYGADFLNGQDETLEGRVWAPISELKKIGEVINGAGGHEPGANGQTEYSLSTDPPQPHCSQGKIFPSNNCQRQENSITLMETDLDDDENAGLEACFLENLRKAGNTNISVKGIQGQSNSCYIDASIFILFSFTTIFDTLLLQSDKPSSTDENAAIRTSLSQIVTKLRTDFLVPSSDIYNLRVAIGSINKGYSTGCFMDAEELLLDLFDCLDCPDFFEFTNQATDRIHQIVVPASNEFGSFSDDNIYVKDIVLLVKDSLWYNEVKLAKRPLPALILKLPFCNGKPLFGCKIVVPNLKLALEPITQLNEPIIWPAPMHLFAIMCLKSSHYVCYVKCGNEEFSPWIYFDSSPVDMKPKIHVLETLSYDLVKVGEDPGILKYVDSANTLEFREHVNLICNYCYMCFYK